LYVQVLHTDCHHEIAATHGEVGACVQALLVIVDVAIAFVAAAFWFAVCASASQSPSLFCRGFTIF
jgi:hypothetical protein